MQTSFTNDPQIILRWKYKTT